MIPALVRYQLDAGAGTLGLSWRPSGSARCSGRPPCSPLSPAEQGRARAVGFFVCGAAIARHRGLDEGALSLVLAFVGGLPGVVFMGLSTVVVQSMAPNELRAACHGDLGRRFVGVLPLGALITAGLAALAGRGRGGDHRRHRRPRRRLAVLPCGHRSPGSAARRSPRPASRPPTPRFAIAEE